MSFPLVSCLCLFFFALQVPTTSRNVQQGPVLAERHAVPGAPKAISISGLDLQESNSAGPTSLQDIAMQ